MEDILSELAEPITHESVCEVLHSRFSQHEYHTIISSNTLISINPQTHRLSHKALTCSHKLSRSFKLLISNALEDVVEKRQSHAVIISGESGSGKTHTFMELLKYLFDKKAGKEPASDTKEPASDAKGPSSDTPTLISAAMTVLKPFDTVATSSNPESSRSCWAVECTLSSRSITSAHITLYSQSYSRLSRRPVSEQSYDVFYMILAGMTNEEREKCCLTEHTEDSLRYLQSTYRKPVSTKFYREKYVCWKESLAMLGINYVEILKMLAAILLLGNVSFVTSERSIELEVEGCSEWRSIGALLGVPVSALYQSFTVRSAFINGQYYRSINSTNYAINRIVELRLSSIAESSGNRNEEGCCRNDFSTDGAFPTTPKSRSTCLRIIDCLGFQDNQGTQLEQLCSNICAEAGQNFYNVNTFPEPHFNDEDGIAIQRDVEWHDNSSTIQLLTRKDIGVISLIHSESQQKQPKPRSLIKALETLHSESDSLEVDRAHNLFTVRHFGGRVTYSCEILLLENRNFLPDDILAIMAKLSTQSTPLTKLFGKELKDFQENGGEPRGVSYRAIPCQFEPYHMGPSSHCFDFLSNMDRLMQMLACSNPAFVRCIKASPSRSQAVHGWDKEHIISQLGRLEVTETVKMLSVGFPHKIPFKQFVSTYGCLTRRTLNNQPISRHCCEKLAENIINHYLCMMKARSIPLASAHWMFGKKQIFLSEDVSCQLNMLRDETRQNAASKIQSTFRGWLIKQSWPAIVHHMRSQRQKVSRKPSHTYDSGYNTPQPHKTSNVRSTSVGNVTVATGIHHDLCVDNADHLFQWKPTFQNMQDMGVPTIPEKRNYSVQSGMKVYFPQLRVMKEDLNVEGYELRENCEIMCVGYSTRPSYVSIAFQNDILDIPYNKTCIRISDKSDISCRNGKILPADLLLKH